MKETAIDYNSLFRRFCGNNEMRPVFHTPHRQGDYYFASNAHVLLMMSVTEAELDYSVTDTPNFIAVVPTILHEPKLIDVTRLIELLNSIPLVDYTRDCMECGGLGYQECDLGHEHECEDCGGTGKIGDSKKKVKDEDARIELFGQVFKSGFVELLVSVAATLGETSISKISGTGIKGGLFSVGPMSVLLMPHMNHDEKKVFKYLGA